jgi:hypothetical protein
MRRQLFLVKRLSLKTARFAEQESCVLMFGCVNWITLAMIFVVAFGLLGINLSMRTLLRWRASRDSDDVFLPLPAAQRQQVRRATGEASLRAAATAHRGVDCHRFPGHS